MSDRSWFGNAVDGDFTTSGDFTMTKDMFYDDLTVSAGHTYRTNGWRLFVAGTLTLGTGAKIDNGGYAPVGSTGGFGGPGVNNGSATGGNGQGNMNGGGNGGDGVVGPSNGWPFTMSAAGSPQRTQSTQIGGLGGASASYVAGTIMMQASLTTPYHPAEMLGGFGPQFNQYGGGGGGTSGGADSGSTSGAGGGGGGVVVVFARNITGTGTIESKGGDGGAASGPSGGGGGGGSGGTVSLLTEDTSLPSINVAGGNGGSGSGTGAAGATGGAGVVIAISTTSGPL